MNTYDLENIFGSGADASLIASIMAFFIALIGLFIIIGIVCYIFQSLGVYTIAKNKGEKYPWLAWIPVASNYLIGKIGSPKNAEQWFPWVVLALPLVGLMYIPAISGLSFVAGIVFIFIALYNIYKQLTDNPVLFLVLSIIFPITIPFFLFAFRNKPIKTEVTTQS